MRQPKIVTISLVTSNAAFDDCEHGEIARILRNEAREIAGGRLGTGLLVDLNGNSCGRVTVTDDELRPIDKPEGGR